MKHLIFGIILLTASSIAFSSVCIVKKVNVNNYDSYAIFITNKLGEKETFYYNKHENQIRDLSDVLRVAAQLKTLDACKKIEFKGI